MNAKLLMKTLFIILVALLLVLMGMNNYHKVDFTLPPILNRVIQQPAALMYLTFFAVGLLTGTIMTAGGSSKKGGSTKSTQK